MSRPESQHVSALKTFREKLVEARRAAVADQNLEAGITRFVQIQHALDLYEAALSDELDLTPLPQFDDPTAPPPAT